MSRCFPYPPPGYTLSRTSKEALIESIKLQKERKKAKEQRKEKKRKEKTDKSKERKNKKNENITQIPKKSDIPVEHLCKNILANIKQLEKSSLTEEHGQPVCLRAPSSSSDSTENSNKRKRESSPIDGNHGTDIIIKIRLPLKMLNANEQLCSISRRTDIQTQGKVDASLRNMQENLCGPSMEAISIGQGLTLSADKELSCLNSEKTEPVTPAIKGTPLVLHTRKASKQASADLHYSNLIENLVPALLQDPFSKQEDLDWLLRGRNQRIPSEKRQKSANYITACSGGSSLYHPCAEYLLEAEVFALPYVIPF